jgi:hypothetical protein
MSVKTDPYVGSVGVARGVEEKLGVEVEEEREREREESLKREKMADGLRRFGFGTSDHRSEVHLVYKTEVPKLALV